MKPDQVRDALRHLGMDEAIPFTLHKALLKLADIIDDRTAERLHRLMK